MAITDSTRTMLRSTIADGLANNIGLDEIAADIAGAYAFSPDRAAVIAATEVSRANSMVSLESYRSVADLGVTVRKAWLVTTACCDVCAANADAAAIDLDDAFPNGDDTPPGHPNCRCSLTPVVGDDGTAPATKVFDPGEGRDSRGRWTASTTSQVIAAAQSQSSGVTRSIVGKVRHPESVSAIAGVDVRSFRHTLSSQGVAHTLHKHGSARTEARRGQIPIVPGDFHRVKEIVASFERVSPSESRWPNGRTRLVIEKTIDNVAYTYVAEVQAGKRRIEMVTMWKK